MDPVGVAAARQLCARCPVQLRCLAGALARGEQLGVWGGWVFKPSIVEARVLLVDLDQPDIQAGIQSAVTCTAAGIAGGDDAAAWLVRTTDRLGRHRIRGWFATHAEAAQAVERWLRESEWREEMGQRFAAVLSGVVPDHELHAPAMGDGDLESRQRVQSRRRPAVGGSVDGQLDELVSLLVRHLGVDSGPRASHVRVAGPTRGKAA